MKLPVIVLVLFVAQCQSRGHNYRRQLAPQPTTTGQFPNVFTHQTNVLTGRLIVRVSDFLGFVINRLEQVKKLFDDWNLATLSSYAGYLIDFLKQYNQDGNSDENNYKRNQFGGIIGPERPCEPFDDRYECQNMLNQA